MPDMTRYAGDGAGIKAITGGDKVSIDPKHKAPYSTRIQAVVLAVNNNAMTFSDRSGGFFMSAVNRAFSCAYQPRAFRDMRQRQDGGLHRAALGLSMSARTGSYHQKGKYDVQYHPD